MSDFEQIKRTKIDHRIGITPWGDLRLSFRGRREKPTIYFLDPIRNPKSSSPEALRSEVFERRDHI